MGTKWATSRRKRRLQQAITVRDGKHCHYCGVPLILTDEITTRCILHGGSDAYIAPPGYRMAQLDHVQPRSKGGSNHLDNLVLACGPCNASKGVTLNG